MAHYNKKKKETETDVELNKNNDKKKRVNFLELHDNLFVICVHLQSNFTRKLK